MLREVEAACSPAPALRCSGSSSLTGSPDNPLRSSAKQALPVWRSHGLTALLRSLQSEFNAAEKALAAALEQQSSGLHTSHEESIEWSIRAMREVASVDKFATELGLPQAHAKLLERPEEACELTE